MDFVSTNVAGFQSGTSVNYVMDGRGVQGMALLEDQLFVTRLGLNQVLVHNTDSPTDACINGFWSWYGTVKCRDGSGRH